MMGGLMTAASKKEGWITNGERPGGEKLECRRVRGIIYVSAIQWRSGAEVEKLRSCMVVDLLKAMRVEGDDG